MADLTVSYMGCELSNPIIAGASELTSDMENIRKIEKAGAGALVIKSLFEEQIQLEKMKMEEELHRHDNYYAEMLTVHPEIKHSGADEHLMWTEKAKKSVGIPVFGSLNCINEATWVDYAKKMEETGIDGLELNFYMTPTDMEKGATEIEDSQIRTLEAVKKAVSLPLSVKLSPFYTNPQNFISRADKTGIGGIVLFNRLFQPEIDLESEKNVFPFNLSAPVDQRLPLRYAGLLFENVDADVCASTGLFSGTHAAKMILAGACCVQTVSSLYRHGIEHIGTMIKQLEDWMKGKGYGSLADFRGKMSRKNNSDPWVYKRSQYVRMLMKGNPLV